MEECERIGTENQAVEYNNYQGSTEIVMVQGDINILNVQHTFRSTSQIMPANAVMFQENEIRGNQLARSQIQQKEEALPLLEEQQSGRDVNE